MKMFVKLLFLFVLLPALIAGCSCDRRNSGLDGLEIREKSKVQENVKNWVVYTNPAYRYELRAPRDWEILDMERKGETVFLYPKESQKPDLQGYRGAIMIRGFSNWQANFELEEFIKSRSPYNYYMMIKDGEVVEIEYKGYDAIWFKNIKAKRDKYIDAIVVDLDDSILIMEIWDNPEQATNIISSLYFYGR